MFTVKNQTDMGLPIRRGRGRKMAVFYMENLPKLMCVDSMSLNYKYCLSEDK